MSSRTSSRTTSLPTPARSKRAQGAVAATSSVELPPLGPEYLDYLRFERRLAPDTLDNYRANLLDLVRFCEGAPARQIDSLTDVDVRRFLAMANSRGLARGTIAQLLVGWRGYFRFRLKHGLGIANPCDGVRPPKAAKRLPRVLSPDEAIRLVSFDPAIANDEVQGIRDRAIFELIYSCGLRIGELVGMDLSSVDLANGEARVTGKGNKTRIVPVGKPALEALRQWLATRASLPVADANALFIGKKGNRVSRSVLETRIKRYARLQGIDVDVHPHMLRHSFASHLLQSSQNLRAVQELMGHASIASTQVYTHLDFQHLASVYDKAHPRARKK